MLPVGQIQEHNLISQAEPVLQQIKGSIAINDPAALGHDLSQFAASFCQRANAQVAEELNLIDVKNR